MEAENGSRWPYRLGLTLQGLTIVRPSLSPTPARLVLPLRISSVA